MPERKRTRLAAERIADLIQTLAERGFRVIAPTVQDGAIVYAEVGGAEDLPRGWIDRQEPGRYRLERRADQAWFGYNLGPQSPKRHLFPSQATLFAAEHDDGLFRILPPAQPPPRPLAFVGVRACEMAAIAIQDKVLLEGPFRDASYAARRAGIFVAAVNCTQSAPTCFCASMGTGPQAPAESCDLVLTEVINGGEHWFLAEAGTGVGADVLARLDPQPAGEDDCRRATAAIYAAAQAQTRRIDCENLRETLESNFEHEHWDDVAHRCLACANCTMVCPTCFCTTIEDHSGVAGARAERRRLWDSCFTSNFSYIHGGSVRTSVKARYRQWLTHKLATWIDQFGSPGCVGCGRCITWCPVGIDLTEEARAICRDGNHGNTVA